MLVRLLYVSRPAVSLNDETLDAILPAKMRVDVPHRKLGSVGYVRNGLRLSDTPADIHSPSPELGEHNDEIFGALGVKV